jgi:hypothetical protein
LTCFYEEKAKKKFFLKKKIQNGRLKKNNVFQNFLFINLQISWPSALNFKKNSRSTEHFFSHQVRIILKESTIVVGFLKIIHSLFCEKLEISSEFVTLFELGICIFPNPDYP